MAIMVHFPDGSQREVAGQLCRVNPTAAKADARYRQVPVNCDPQWRYVRVGAKWYAIARHGALAILSPPVDDWWQGIDAMADMPAASNTSRAA